MEETLLELINDDDEVAAAAAIDLVGINQLWALRDDVEHVLSHRDVSDWYVFEAASWTLAAHALTAEGRGERWHESLPAAALVDRMRGLSLFASVGIDELFRIAGAGHQARHEGGTTLFREGSSPEQLHVLLDGEAIATGRRTGARQLASPATVGFEEALDGCLMSETIKTDGPAVTLSLSNDELRTLLADNSDLVQGLFRTLAARQGTRKGFVQGARRPSSSASATSSSPVCRKGWSCAAFRYSRRSPGSRCCTCLASHVSSGSTERRRLPTRPRRSASPSFSRASSGSRQETGRRWSRVPSPATWSGCTRRLPAPRLSH